MKLFVFAALIAVAAAGRLEHLERAYLPPFGSNSFGQPGFNAATINQYLPPDHGPSASASEPQFAGSLTGFNGLPQSNQYAASSFGSQGPSSFAQQRYQQQQYGAHSHHFDHNSDPTQNIPQQAFDEQTGYHY